MSLHFSEGVSGDGTLFYGRGSLVIHGDKGILEAEWNGWNPSGASVYISSKAERIEFKPLNSDMSPAHALVDAILNNGTNYAPPGECINAVLFSEATYKSLRRQKPINL